MREEEQVFAKVMKLLFVHDRFGALAGAEANISHAAAEFQRRGHAVGILHSPGTGRREAGLVQPWQAPLTQQLRCQPPNRDVIW